MTNSPVSITAIDGPSASGKGTVAKRLAAHFGFAHLDTGLLYRAVAAVMLLSGDDPADAAKAEKVAVSFTHESLSELINNQDLRGDKVSNAASKVAAHEGVRAALLKFQRDFCASPPEGKKGAVLDGRDIGTVIAPQAPVKIYVTAGMEARAQRRFKELQGRGEDAAYAAVLADMKERDARDASRPIAPAKPASDAVILETTDMTADQAFVEAVRIAEEKLR